MGKALLKNYAIGTYGVMPFAKEKKGYYIKGELYKLSERDLNMIDFLKSKGLVYDREKKFIYTENGIIQAYFYTMNEETKTDWFTFYDQNKRRNKPPL